METTEKTQYRKTPAEIFLVGRLYRWGTARVRVVDVGTDLVWARDIITRELMSICRGCFDRNAKECPRKRP